MYLASLNEVSWSAWAREDGDLRLRVVLDNNRCTAAYTLTCRSWRSGGPEVPDRVVAAAVR